MACSHTLWNSQQLQTRPRVYQDLPGSGRPLLHGELFAALQKHYEPTRAVIAERFHFQKRDQVPDESLAEYDAVLRKLATHCNFGAYLTEALRDRFVAGLRSEAMQRRH